jgi:hypothetical protein
MGLRKISSPEVGWYLSSSLNANRARSRGLPARAPPQNNFLIEFERGLEARGYEHNEMFVKF